MRLWTGELAAPLTITKGMGVQILNLKVAGNGATITGDFPLPINDTTSLPASTIGLADGDSQFITAGPGNFIEGVTITPGAASVEVEIFF